jgi:propionyl-CoA carboxylase alpha chain
VVKSGKEQHDVTVVETAMGHAVIAGRRSRELVSAWTIGDPLYRGRIDDRPIIAQIDRDGVGYRLTHAGAQLKIMVLSPRAAELAGHMLEKTPPDLSKFLLSPMPGLLVTVAVQEGQDVKAGQELAVVEAMKMENLLRAERDGKVAKLHAKPGDSLSVDQVIVEFA